MLGPLVSGMLVSTAELSAQFRQLKGAHSSLVVMMLAWG